MRVHATLGIGAVLAFAACSSTTTTQEAEATGGRVPAVGGSAGSGPASGAGSGGAEATLCEQYCDTVMGACTEELAVYDSVGACLAVCAGLPEGSPGDEIGNTVQCRLHEASLASQLIASERTANCARSGPIGSGTCGANCEGYCVLMNEFCAAGFETEFQTLAGCIAACTALPDLGTYDLSMNSGDSVQCRAWHVTFAAIAPTDHCVHAAGALPCAD